MKNSYIRKEQNKTELYSDLKLRAVLHVQHITKSLKIGSYTSHTCTYIRSDTAGTFATKFHNEIRPFLIQSYTL